MSVTISERDSGTHLAQADVGPSLVKYEGNWYFDPVQSGPISCGSPTALTRVPTRGPVTGSTMSDPTVARFPTSPGSIPRSSPATS